MSNDSRYEATGGKLAALSTGAKLLLLCALALLMSLLALFIDSLVNERSARGREVRRDISAHMGGPQTFLGPTLLVPYTVPGVTPVKGAPSQSAKAAQHGIYVVFPAVAEASLNTTAQERRRSLYKVPIFQADAEFKAEFDLAGPPSGLTDGAVLDWSAAEMVVGVSDAHAALADAQIKMDGGALMLTPATLITTLNLGEADRKLPLSLLGSNMRGAAHPGAEFSVEARLRFSGAQHVAVLPFGKSTHLSIRGDWASPGFDGGSLPSTREVSDRGFRADWTVPYIARGVVGEGDLAAAGNLNKAALGVSFVEVADPYQSVDRSLKYAPLFLGLVFLTYFLFEISTGRPVHPAQYLLVGLAQLIFYLLLLSFAERAGFGWGFLFAGGATVLLLATNVGWVFQSRMHALRAGGVFGTLYGMIYMLLRLEDNALMLGALGSFAAVTATMYFTRRIDWYRAGSQMLPDARPTLTPAAPFRVGEL